MAGALSSDQMSAMMGTGDTQPRTPQNNQNAQPEWLTAMMNSSLQPSQSSAVLGHSTGVMGNLLKGAGAAASAMLPSPKNNMETDMATLHQIGNDFGAQNAGPVGADMTAHAPQQLQDAFKAQPTTPAGQTAAGITSVADSVVGPGAEIGAAKSSGLLSKIGDMTGVTDWLAKRATNKAVNAVASTADTMSKAEREAAIAEGRQQAGFLSNSFAPSKTEARAGELLTGKIGGNPIKNVPVVQSEIAARGKEAETFLQANARPITNQEDFNAFAKQREVSSTYLTPTAEKAYDEQMNVFQKVLKGYVKDGGYNTSNYYQALKEFESNVTQNLPKGKEALLDEGGSARLQAAKDVRHVVRDMIGSKNPEFKDKMFDLASLYDARDNVITKAEKSGHGLQQLIKKYPKTSGAIGALGGLEANKTLKDWTGIGF